ncbi:MAG: hypothetical protein JHC33_01870 [Ignisphaera sp.]|nr:hypothetical protein [Ignisphaera sp.]
MKNKVNKELLDRVLADLNLTDQQMLEEGMWDRVKAAGSAFSNPQQIAIAQAASNLKANTLQTIEKLKQLANTLEAQANAKDIISPKDASAIYAQLNAFIVSSIKGAQAAMANQPQPVAAQPIQAAPANPAQPTSATLQPQVQANPAPVVPAGTTLGSQAPTVSGPKGGARPKTQAQLDAEAAAAGAPARVINTAAPSITTPVQAPYVTPRAAATQTFNTSVTNPVSAPVPARKRNGRP